MDFTLTDEQTALRDSVRGLLKQYDAGRRREVTALDPGYDEAMWGRLAELGALGLPFAEDVGGMGAGPIEANLVAEEIGRALAPEPYVESVVLAGTLIDTLGTDAQRADLIEQISEGRLVVAVAWPSPGSVSTEGDSVTGTVLTGTVEPVLVGGRADLVLVITDDAVLAVEGAGLERTSYRTIDSGRAARVTFAGTPAQRLGDGSGDHTAGVARAVAAARVAYGSESVGAMDTALRMTTEYLTTRKQFGLTLNKFQALTFRAADMYTSLELTRSIVQWASMVVADPDSTPAQVVEAGARAKLQVSRSGRHLGQEAIQLHGGIGMTAEYAVGHYVARLTAIDHLLGDGNAQVRDLARTLSDHTVVEPLR